MRDVTSEAEDSGVDVKQAKKVPIHGKMLLSTPDDVVITSHNWGSASSNISFPQAEVGVHVQSPELAKLVLARMEQVYPELKTEQPDITSSRLP
jgi:phosphatidylserine/phosphatidylglycerophosphate/cardiolipin synthase-like enzyme